MASLSRLRLGVLVFCLLAAGTVSSVRAAGPEDGSRRESAGPSVFVTVVPLASVVERIGADRVHVEALVRPGQDPHTYEPTPRQVVALSKADLYLRVGLPLEDAWLPRIQGTNPHLRVVDLRDGLGLEPNASPRHDEGSPSRGEGANDKRAHVASDTRAESQENHERDVAREGHDHGAEDPHIWTSPPLVKAMAARIRDILVELSPADQAYFGSNYARYAAELDALDTELRTRLAPFAGKRFMVFHPAWGYFAEAYGLVQVPVEYQGKEPGARALAALIDSARVEGIKIVLVQPQMSPRAAEQIAAAIGGRVASVDPLSRDLLGTWRQLADLIAATPGR